MNHNFLKFLLIVAVALLIGMGPSVVRASQLNAVDATYIVNPDNLQGWGFEGEGAVTYGFVPGPGTPPFGTGSLRFEETGVNDGLRFQNLSWGGTFLSNLTSLSYSTYHDPTSLGEEWQQPYLMINIDYDLADTNTSWQGRLIFEPYLTPENDPEKGIWQTWNALTGKWWADTAPGNAICPKINPCNLSTLIASYPNIGVATYHSAVMIEVGSFYNGMIANVDGFIIGISGSTATYDFEPNAGPVAYNQLVPVAEDTAKAITLTATNVGAGPLTWTIMTDPTHGTLTGTAPSLTYTPALNYSGPDSFTFKLNDGVADSNTATVSITVTAVNDAPVANNQSVTPAEDTAKAITLTASDVEGDPLTWIIVTDPTHGTLSGTAPALTYTPALNYNGADSFTFKVNDGTVDSNTATVSITVTPVNDAPVANNQSVTTAEDTAKAITLTASDVDSNPLTWTVVTLPAHGTLTGTAPALTYTPALNYNGPDSFTFKVNDGTVDSNTATVSITITPVNDAPVANNQSVTTAEDTAKAITLTASDVEANPLTWTILTNPTHGTLTGTAPALTYTPALNYNGPDSFTFKVNDGTVDSNTATVSITVTSVNDAPVANNQSVTTAEDTTKAITLTASDVEGDPLTWTIVTLPAHGTLAGTAPALTYTPALNYNGPDSFTFKVNDGAVDSNTATISITVTPVNDAPVADNQLVVTAEDTAKAITLTATDVEGSLLIWTIITPPAHGTLTGTAPALTYTPVLNYHGPDSFTFKVNDGTVDSNTATVSITVTSVNDVPLAVNDAYTMKKNTILIIATPGVLINDSDADGDPLTATRVENPLHGTVTQNADGSFTYTPLTSFFGSDSFTYRVNDGTVNSNIATVTITVEDVTYYFYLPIAKK